MPSDFIKIQHLAKAYQGGKYALRDVTMNIQKGNIHGIIGESGAGKSTLLKLLAGLEDAESGSIHVDGEQIFGPLHFLVPGYRHIKLVRQDFGLFPINTVAENIAYPIRTWKPELKKERLQELLDLFRLNDVAHRKPSDISGGQQQRAAIAAALSDEPPILLLDEPFSHLDAFLRNQLKLDLQRLAKEWGTTIVLVSHEVADTLAISDEVTLIRDGGIEMSGPPMDVYRQPTSAYAASFLGHENIFNSNDLPFAVSGESDKVLIPDHAIALVEKDDSVTLHATIVSTLFMGDYAVLGFSLPNGIILFKKEWIQNTPSIGDEVRLSIQTQYLVKLEE